jgi:hypothetical protein
MSLTLKKAQAEAEQVLSRMREAAVLVARMRFDAVVKAGGVPGVVEEVGYLLNTGRYDMARNLVDLHEEYIEAQVNLDIARQSARYEHNIDVEGEPSYLADGGEPPSIRLSEWEYEKVLSGEPGLLGTGWSPEVVRMPREEK